MTSSLRRTDLLALSNLRNDGRKPHEIRRMRIQMGPLSSKDVAGSALVEMGLTVVLATVRGPMECTRRSDEVADRAVLEVTVKSAPFAPSTDRRVTNPNTDRRLVEHSNLLKKAMESSVLVRLFPKSRIEIVVWVLADDGGRLCAAVNATTCALVHAGVPMRDLVCSCSSGWQNDTPIIDLNRMEELGAGTDVTAAVYMPVACMPQRGTVVLAQCEARLPNFTVMEQVLDAGLEACRTVFDILQAAIREYASTHLAARTGHATIIEENILVDKGVMHLLERVTVFQVVCFEQHKRLVVSDLVRESAAVCASPSVGTRGNLQPVSAESHAKGSTPNFFGANDLGRHKGCWVHRSGLSSYLMIQDETETSRMWTIDGKGASSFFTILKRTSSFCVPSTPRKCRAIETFLFFLSGVGSTVGWTAVLSNLVFYSETLGKDSYLFLNVAVYFPLLPITLAQARWDSYFDRQFSSLVSFSFRGAVGFALSVLTVALMPLVSFNLTRLSLVTLVLGISSSILHGTVKQMASFVYPDSKILPAAVTGGMQSSAALVLIVSVSTGFGGSKTSAGLWSFYVCIATISLLCWVAFSFLMRHSNDVWNSMRQRDSSIGSSIMMRECSSMDRLREPLLEQGQNTSSLARLEPEDASSAGEENRLVDCELSNREIWVRTWPVCATLMVTVASSMSVASWFNRIASADPTNLSLPQVLFYVRLFSDLLGRPTTLLVGPTSLSCVAMVAITRLSFVPLFFLYASSWEDHLLPRNDVIITLGVTVFAFTSGYIATGCYQLAPDLLLAPDGQDYSSSIPKQTSLVNVCFGASILMGLGVSFVLLGAGL